MICKIGLGTVQFGMDYGISNKSGKTSLSEVASILIYAKQVGIGTLDTANSYGESEIILGDIGVDFFKVVSKFLPENESGVSILEQFNRSLEVLKLKSLYAYLAHRPEDIINDLSQWDQMKKIKDLGKVNKIGFSFNTTRDLEKLLERDIWPDIVQVPFNYFDQRFVDLMKTLHSRGCEVHSRSTFLQGLFFSDPETLPSHFNQVKKIINEIRLSSDKLPSRLLRFALEQPFIDKVIIGVESKIQLQENIEELSVVDSLPDISFNIPESILIPTNWP